MHRTSARSHLMRSVWLAALLAIAAPARAQGPPTGPTSDDLFNGAVVGELQLWLNTGDWEKLKENFQDNTYYPADLHWNGFDVQNVGIRSRGTGSRSPNKPGLRVDFDRYSTDQEFLGLKSFVLDNLTQDPSMIKERITMLFFQKMGLPAPREAHVKLVVNGAPAGLYAIVESIDKRFLKARLGENDGYLYEYKNSDNYGFQELGENLTAYEDFFKPQTHETASQEKLYRSIADMVATINDAPLSQFESKVGEYLDLPLFLTHVAIESFVAEHDGLLGYAGMNNFYLYQFERQKRFQFLVWDKDTTFYDLATSVWDGAQGNVLFSRAMELDNLRDVFLAALKKCAEAASEPPPATTTTEIRGLAGRIDKPRAVTLADSGPGWFEREAQRMLDQIRAAALEDNLKPFLNERFEDEASKVLRFSRERAGQVMSQVSEGAESRRP